jgi:hypothetical protein
MTKLSPVAPLAALLFLFSCSPPSEAEQTAAKVELHERIATVINLSGHLCAKVIFVGPLISSGEYQGEYQVNCDEFRDPSMSSTEHNIAVYMVNPETYTVRPMGPT